MAEYIEKWSVVNRLIDIENEFQQYKPFHGFEHAMYRKICEAEIAIGKTQAANVAPVVHGHWIYHPDDLFPNDSTQECSYCHAEESLTLYNENYCPNCGARMDEVIE